MSDPTSAPTNALVVPLRGTFFRPFGKRLLENLPAGTELTLRAEPGNEHDPQAIATYVDPKSAPNWEDLAEEAEAFGLTEEDWEEPFHLGYVGKEHTNQVGSAFGQEGPWQGSLGFAPDGKPTIILAAQAQA